MLMTSYVTTLTHVTSEFSPSPVLYALFNFFAIAKPESTSCQRAREHVRGLTQPLLRLLMQELFNRLPNDYPL